MKMVTVSDQTEIYTTNVSDTAHKTPTAHNTPDMMTVEAIGQCQKCNKQTEQWFISDIEIQDINCITKVQTTRSLYDHFKFKSNVCMFVNYSRGLYTGCLKYL